MNTNIQNNQSNKKRTIWRITLLIVSILTAIAAVVFFVVYRYRQSDDYSKYTENGSSTYSVVLKEDYNPYGGGVDSSNMQYLSSKIEGVNAKLTYKLNMKEDDVDYKYTYTLKEVVQVVSKETGKTIISYQKQIKTKTVNSVRTDELEIGETHYLDYLYHDRKITEFINQQSDLRTHSVVSTLKLVLEINLKGTCEDFEDDFSKHPTIYISVPLATDTVLISGGSNITKGEGEIILCNNLSNDKPYLIMTYVFAATAALLIAAWYVHGVLTMSPSEKFVKTVNKIETNYSSYIQHIDYPISQDYQQVIELSKFVDLLEVSNIIKRPVFIEKKTDDEVVFVVSEPNTRIYMFRLNKDSFVTKNKDIKPKKLPKQEKVKQLEESVVVEDIVSSKSLDVEKSIDEKIIEEKHVKSKKEKPVKPAKVKKEKPIKIKANKKSGKDQQSDIEPVEEEGPVDKSASEAQNVVRSAKINRTMNHYTKQTSDKGKIYDIIETDLKNLDKKSKEESVSKKDEKPAVKKSTSTKSAKTKSAASKNTNSKTKKATSKSAKEQKKSKSPAAVNLSFDGVDTGKVINVSIQTSEVDD